MNSIAVEVEISIVRGANGIPLSFFDANHPFARREFHRPLPYFEFEDKLHYNNNTTKVLSVIIEEQLTITPPSLDLKSAFNCFNQVPSGGAKYSIKLCVDIPDNKNPMSLPPDTGSETGHTFIVINKENGNSRITQVFGFYAYKHPGYLFPWRPLSSVIKNNQLREINASIEMNLTEVQFELIRKNALALAKNKYAAASYNCSNYALDLFNSVRINPITIGRYTVYVPVPFPHPVIIEKTPQMIFNRLKEFKGNNDSLATSIVIDQTSNTKAPLSHGECK